ncbi:MAG: cation:proton antiporter [Oscillospiraceae bacterium]
MLTSLALIFLCGLLLGAIFQKLRLPSLIGMLLAGIVLGPYALNLLDESILSISADLRQLALIVILLRAGLSLDLADLKKIGRPAVLMSFVPACFEMLGTILLAPALLNLPLLDAALLAAVVASASPAVIVPRMLRLMDTGYGMGKHIPQLVLAGDSVDDIFNIVVFTALLGLANGQTVSASQFIVVPVSIFSGIAGGALVGILLSFFFKKVHIRDSGKVIILLSTAFLLVALEDVAEGVLPFSGLLAAMAAGVVIFKKLPIAAKRISVKFSKLWVGAEVLLFVLVGASVNISSVAAAGWRTLVLLVAVLAIRAVGILLCLAKTPLNLKERIFCTFTGIPKATVQAAIGSIPLAMGLPSGEIILAVAVISILFTAPLGAFLLDFSYKRLLTKSEPEVH